MYLAPWTFLRSVDDQQTGSKQRPLKLDLWLRHGRWKKQNKKTSRVWWTLRFSHDHPSAGGHLCCCHLSMWTQQDSGRRGRIALKRDSAKTEWNRWRLIETLLTLCLTCEPLRDNSLGNGDGEGRKTDYFKNCFSERHGREGVLFLLGFYGLNAGIVKGQGTQAKPIKKESVCVYLLQPCSCVQSQNVSPGFM